MKAQVEPVQSFRPFSVSFEFQSQQEALDFALLLKQTVGNHPRLETEQGRDIRNAAQQRLGPQKLAEIAEMIRASAYIREA